MKNSLDSFTEASASPASVAPKLTVPVPTVTEINRLHRAVVQHAEDSRKSLNASLVAAWKAGHLLIAEQKHVRRTMGAAWGHWLDKKFQGSRRTAQNYMRLAKTTEDVSIFQGMSLRQVYLRLGIATEPKCRTDSARCDPLPAYIRLSGRLIDELCSYEKKLRADPGQAARLQDDFGALYARLRRLFEPHNATKSVVHFARSY